MKLDTIWFPNDEFSILWCPIFFQLSRGSTLIFSHVSMFWNLWVTYVIFCCLQFQVVLLRNFPTGFSILWRGFFLLPSKMSWGQGKVIHYGQNLCVEKKSKNAVLEVPYWLWIFVPKIIKKDESTVKTKASLTPKSVWHKETNIVKLSLSLSHHSVWKITQKVSFYYKFNFDHFWRENSNKTF